MELFLDTYASLCNKIYPINIFFGTKINDTGFNIKLKDTNITNILIALNKIDNISLEPTYDKINEYRYNNEVYVKDSIGINIYSYIITNSFLDNNIYLQKLEKQYDNMTPQSIFQYDNVDEYNLMTININNMFDIEIRNFKDYNTCMLSIKKPNSKTYIIPILDTIRQSINK